MIQLKGNTDDKNSIMAGAAKRMGMPTVDRETGHVSMSGPRPQASAPAHPPQRSAPPPSKASRPPSNPVYMKSVTSTSYDEDDDADLDDVDASKQPSAASPSDDDDDDLLDGDEDAKAMKAFHDKRISELRSEAKKRMEFTQRGHGEYNPIREEDFLPSVTKSKFSIVHFFHKDFERCKIVDLHLSQLAAKHFATKFCSLDAEKAPFFIGKLQIKTLPTIVMFKDGVAIDRIVGFDELGGKDDFTTAQLEKRLEKAGVLVTVDKKTQLEKEDERDRKLKGKNKIRQSKGNGGVVDDDDDDDDDD